MNLLLDPEHEFTNIDPTKAKFEETLVTACNVLRRQAFLKHKLRIEGKILNTKLSFIFSINLFRFECAVDYEPKEFVDEHEQKLWDNLALDKWPTKLYELVKGTNT